MITYITQGVRDAANFLTITVLAVLVVAIVSDVVSFFV